MGEKRKAWKMIECIRDRGEQPPTGLRHLSGQKKEAAERPVDRARMNMEEESVKELLNGNGAASCLELPSSVRINVDVGEIGQE